MRGRLKVAFAGILVVASIAIISAQVASRPAETAVIETPTQTPQAIEQEVEVEATPEPTPVAEPQPVTPQPAPRPAQPPKPTPPPRATVFSGGMAGELIVGVNAVRANAGLAPVYEEPLLNQSALIEANTLCSSNVWAHGDFGGIMRSIGYNYKSAGENLAKNFITSGGIIRGWTNSPSHYANMVGDWTEAGMAVITCNNYQGQDSTLLIVSHFGRR